MSYRNMFDMFNFMSEGQFLMLVMKIKSVIYNETWNIVRSQ